eukprot:scaffold52184_cov37-Prasinocladus_malaysianus.AAC.3
MHNVSYNEPMVKFKRVCQSHIQTLKHLTLAQMGVRRGCGKESSMTLRTSHVKENIAASTIMHPPYLASRFLI